MKVKVPVNIVRRHIRAVINNAGATKTGQPELDYFITSRNSQLQRLFWSCIIILCVCTLCYQVKDRVDWYFTYPVSVEISVYRIQFNAKLEIELCVGDIFYMYMHEPNDINKQYMQFNASKHSSVILDVTLTQPNGSELSIKNTVQIVNEITLHGKCSIVNLNGQPAVKTSITTERQMYEMIFNPNTESQIQRDTADGVVNWLLKIRKYELVNSPSNPCVSENEFTKCWKNCVTLQINRIMKCRYFTHSNEITLPPCEYNLLISREELVIYQHQVNDIVFKTDFYKVCGCTRSCSRINQDASSKILFASSTEVPSSNTSKTIITTHEIAVSMEEKLVYDQINLVVDIGGCVGLFVGLTLLSITDIVFTSVKTIKKKYSFQSIKIKSLYAKIFLMYQKQRDIQRKIPQTYLSKSTKVFKAMICTLCVSVSIFTILDRLFYCLSLPTRTIVEIDVLSSVALPSLTLCTLNKKLVRVTGTDYLIFSWYYIDVFGLLDWKNRRPIEEVWNSTILPIKSPHTVPRSDKIATHINVTEINTDVGNCRHFKFEKEVVTTEASYSLMYSLYPSSESCTTDIYLIYITDPSSTSYDITNHMVLPYDKDVQSVYQFQNITRLNTTSRSCNDRERFEACKHNCLIQLLQKANLCYLPFFPLTNRVKECNSSVAAIRSRALAIEILLMVASGKCGCKRLCTETVFFTVIDLINVPHTCSIAQEHRVTTKTIEHIIELKKYPVVALLCDIGNILGITLGLSVLTILTYIHRAVNHK